MPLKKIALIDDEPEFEDIYELYLAGLPGVELHFFAAAEAFLTWQKHQRPDLVLTDINMPVMSGIELARALRRISKDIPIYLVSGDGPQDYATEMQELSIERFLSKPLSAEELCNFIQLDLALPPGTLK